MFKRVNSDVVPFSTNSPAGNRYAFGTTDVSNDIDVNYNENIKKGFGTGPNEFPELEDFNALMFTGSYLAAYLYQAGIPEWNDKQKYYINSIAMGSDGNIYRSLAGTEETPNVNNNPTLAGSVSWKSILSEAVSDSTAVKLTGDQTIDDVKTFSSTIVGNITGHASLDLSLTGGTMTGAITAIRETQVSLGAGNSINLSQGNVFTKTVNATTTFTISGFLPQGASNSFILELTNGGSYTIKWFSGVKWSEGTAPILTSVGVDILGFYSYDGGVTWRGMVLCKDSK